MTATPLFNDSFLILISSLFYARFLFISFSYLTKILYDCMSLLRTQVSQTDHLLTQRKCFFFLSADPPTPSREFLMIECFGWLFPWLYSYDIGYICFFLASERALISVWTFVCLWIEWDD